MVIAALAASPAAFGHGAGGAPLGYTSTVTGVQPAVPGMKLEVLDSDDRLRLTSESSEEIVVLGYEDEPYLRITPNGVFRNVHSPATYLNEDRYARVDLPPAADASAPPEWDKVSDEPAVEWHDHRIHWMSTTAPPVVQEDPGSEHEILDWQVPIEVAGSPATVSGRLDYAPPAGSAFSWIFAAPLAVLVLVGAVGWWYLRYRRRDGRAVAEAPAGAGLARGPDRVR